MSPMSTPEHTANVPRTDGTDSETTTNAGGMTGTQTGTTDVTPRGLTSAEAARRLQQDGPNEVPLPSFSFAKAFFSGLWNLSAWILEAALILEIVLGKGIQAAFVLLMLLFAALNGAIQKRRSNRVLGDISHDLTPVVAVERDGKWTKVDSKDLVRGDLVSLSKGDVLAADVRLLTGSLSLDESSVTGESAPVRTSPGQTAYSGTTVVEGSGLARVTATGSRSRSGKTVDLVNTSAAPGHLQVLLTRIIYYLCLLDTVLTAILVVAALVRHENVLDMLPFFAMMFIASIPVAMPSTFAVSNSFEAKALSSQGVLTSDLTGIQDAANVDVLLLDKTGTITENRTSVASWTNLSGLPDDQALRLALLAADQRNRSLVDAAILDFGASRGLSVDQPADYTPFSPSTGYSQARVTLTGEDSPAGEHTLRLGSYKVLSHQDPQAEAAVQAAHIDFTRGRSVALLVDGRLAGVFLLSDTVRADSPKALRQLRERGITTLMLTGDNQRTAQAVATQVGIPGTVVSRTGLDLEKTDLADGSVAGIADVLPEGKLEIVKALQKRGHIVAMTGDGVNDAPALKQAEVGIAMSNAADVAKKSGKMVLLDDGLTPILRILDAGHRVHQRMITWAISKLARTAELTMFITLAYLVFRYLPLGLNAMVIFTIMNNMVTLMLGTDNAVPSHHPERWDMAHLSRLSFTLAGAWTLVGFAGLWALEAASVPRGQITTLAFVFLELSAIMLMLAARTPKFFWQSAPSRQVWSVQLIDAVITVALTLTGAAMEAPIGWMWLLGDFGVVLVAGVLIDLVYAPLSRRAGQRRSRKRETKRRSE